MPPEQEGRQGRNQHGPERRNQRQETRSEKGDAAPEEKMDAPRDVERQQEIDGKAREAKQQHDAEPEDRPAVIPGKSSDGGWICLKNRHRGGVKG